MLIIAKDLNTEKRVYINPDKISCIIVEGGRFFTIVLPGLQIKVGQKVRNQIVRQLGTKWVGKRSEKLS